MRRRAVLRGQVFPVLRRRRFSPDAPIMRAQRIRWPFCRFFLQALLQAVLRSLRACAPRPPVRADASRPGMRGFGAALRRCAQTRMCGPGHDLRGRRRFPVAVAAGASASAANRPVCHDGPMPADCAPGRLADPAAARVTLQ